MLLLLCPTYGPTLPSVFVEELGTVSGTLLLMEKQLRLRKAKKKGQDWKKVRDRALWTEVEG